MIGLRQFVSGLLRVTALPLLRAGGGVAWTLIVPMLRVLAGVSIIVASIALASDAGPIGMGGPADLKPTAVLAHWHQIAPASLDSTRGFFEKRMRPWVWDAVSAPLKLPSFVFFFLLGLFLGYLGRHRRQVMIFSN